MKRSLFLILLVLMAVPFAAQAQNLSIDSDHSSVGFVIGHTVAKVPGWFTSFSGTMKFDEKNMANSSVEAKINADSIDTRVEARDRHLRSSDFFFVKKFPQIVFTSNKIIPGQVNALQVVGDLTLLGVTKEVVLQATYNGNAVDGFGKKRYGFFATTTIDRTDFGLHYNAEDKSGGKVLSEKVEIVLQIQALPNG